VLEILQDERVTPKFREAWGVTNDPEMATDKDDPFLESIKGKPLRNGRLRLIGAGGEEIVEETFEA
jgi:hypothetical protein